ncbi:MAG: hypothetical protein JWR82_2378 [Blastococcus sp.]|jgi:hypothetical protein|nr:hypothetical protein [Blastococcus sp.]
MPDAWLLLVGGLSLFLLAWTVWTLTRLRRLEGRLDRAWTALDTQLRRRADLVEELARYYPGAVGEERAARLAATAVEARIPLSGDREQAENALGRELRDLPDDLPGLPASLQTDLDGTSIRVALARRFFNDAVRDTRSLRQGRLSRVLHLHGSRPLPRYFDIDDRLEVAVGARQARG